MKTGLITISIAILSAAAASAGTIDLMPGNTGPWSFFATDVNGDPCPSCGTGSIVSGPATPPIGTASANLQTTMGNGDGAESLIDTELDGVLAADITSLGYSTYDITNNGQQFPFLALDIDYDGGTDIWFFEPPYQTPDTGSSACENQGATVTATWQTWDALSGCWWDSDGIGNPGTTEGSTPGVVSFDTLLAAEPGATIVADPNDNGGLQLQVGYGSPTDNFDGDVTNISVGVNGTTNTYEFDLASSVPEPATSLLILCGIAVVGVAKKKLRA